ncbi:MAG: hypothetical protein KF819_17560 [Labilithrix sp.]|nr:hypothetical protein [Labilithrix sp.]
MDRSRLLAVAMVFACASMLVGCKPKAGASCKIETKEVCADAKQALVCHDGKWEEMTCRGPAGCAKTGGEYVCDQSVAEDKDVCNLQNDFVCTSDKKGMLECQKNRWTFVQSCLGERSCLMEQKKVVCDNSIANLGDACREEEDYACSPDKKNALVCRQSKFVVASNCKGKNGCKVTGDKGAGFKVECDDSIANVGDTCDKEGHFACATDERSILKCVGKKFVADEKCRSREKCAVKGDLVGCY